MPFQIVRNDITKVKADIIVNTANPKPICASGTDGAIYEAAGKEKLLDERKKIGDIAIGEIAVTPAFALHASYIIHTVGPVWIDGEHGELLALQKCYRNSLNKAVEMNCEKIAFPLISTGVYGFPKDKALQIAISEISSFLMNYEMLVELVVFDKKSFVLSGKLFQGVDEFIDENYVKEKKISEYTRRYSESEAYERNISERRFRDIPEEETYRLIQEEELNNRYAPDTFIYQSPSMPCGNLDDFMNQDRESFQHKLWYLIDERGLTDVEVYKNANIDRKLFSKIRCNESYKPKKKTVVALALSMKLSLDETKDLLARAELALSPSSKFDLIIEYYISQHVYDIYEINMALFKYNQQILGEW